MSFTLQTRTTLINHHPGLTRSVVHHARPARRPHYPSPLTPLVVKPTAGTSRPQPARREPTTPPHTLLADSSGVQRGLTFHYAPPPSAPSYSNGVVPDLLRWVQGAQVRASEQAGAPLLLRPGQAVVGDKELQVVRSLTADVVAEIQKLRNEDPRKWTRRALAERFQIPATATHHLARLAPAPKTHRAQLVQQAQTTRDGWTWRKRVARDAREVRKEFW
ncbi:hypothetical protein QFC21_005532 [Naganishia friedmannii]|uniref:Uncharacterized protein n=1 Tax=Naganishia friedmannii TaxID=89922 RepID=A0ACC2V960_9TREE|nr:hypothetical protein QFC21_005532 [Naganishia friedmannii]